jgi:protein-tyrosine kinase
MGKLSDALERQQNEREIKAKMLQPISRINKSVSITQNSFDPRLVVCSTPGSVEAENFKILKGQILFSKEGKTPKTIMVTSALPNEGKTFTASNLAASLAQGIDEHALLVDCDFRRPSLHKMFGYSNREGLQEFLTGKKELSDLLIRTKVDKLTLLTAGTSPSNPSEMLSSSMVNELFEELKTRYHDRYIVIDTAPSHALSEVNILANYVDAVIFVVRHGRAPREIVIKCIEKIGKDRVLGIVYNGHDQTNKTYDKYYKKYYQ